MILLIKTSNEVRENIRYVWKITPINRMSSIAISLKQISLISRMANLDVQNKSFFRTFLSFGLNTDEKLDSRGFSKWLVFCKNYVISVIFEKRNRGTLRSEISSVNQFRYFFNRNYIFFGVLPSNITFADSLKPVDLI